MNNSHYVEAARACLPPEAQVREMYVDYKMQARLGDLVIVSAKGEESAMQVTLEDEEGSAYACVEFRCA